MSREFSKSIQNHGKNAGFVDRRVVDEFRDLEDVVRLAEGFELAIVYQDRVGLVPLGFW